MERQPERIPLIHGIQTIGSTRGMSSHQHNPFIIIIEHTASEDKGICYGFMLMYSGNHKTEVELDQLTQKKVVFDCATYFDYTKNQAKGNAYYNAFIALTDAGELDAITMEPESLAALGQSGRLLDLNDPRCHELLEKYADRVIYYTPADEQNWYHHRCQSPVHSVQSACYYHGSLIVRHVVMLKALRSGGQTVSPAFFSCVSALSDIQRSADDAPVCLHMVCLWFWRDRYADCTAADPGF